MQARQWVVILGLTLAGCGPVASPPGASPAGPIVSGEPRSTARQTATADLSGGSGYVLMDLTNPASQDRYQDLVAFDTATGTMLLAPWRAADSWALDTASWLAGGGGLLLGKRLGDEQDGTPPTIEWSKQWLDATKQPDPVAFEAGRVFGVVASLPEGEWFAGTVYGDRGPVHTVFRRADGSGSEFQGPVGRIAWSPHGDAAMIVTDDARLVLIEPGAMAERVLADRVLPLASSGYQPQVLWSPEGGDVLYRGEDCGVCVQALDSGAIRSLDTSGAGDVWDVLGWTPFGVLVMLGGGSPELALLSPDDGRVARVLRPLAYVALSPGSDRIIGMALEPGDASLTIVVIDLASGQEAVYDAPGNVYLANPRWQPARVEVPWPVWAPPGLDAQPEVVAGFVELDVRGAFEANEALPAECTVRDDGVAIIAARSDLGVQVGVSEEGTANFLALGGSGFSSFAGKGFDVLPPYVITAVGSTTDSGSLAFNDIPAIEGAGTVSGTLAWSCPGVAAGRAALP